MTVPSTPATTVSASRRWWALVAIAASVLVIGLDLTVLNLALPTLSRDLHASSGDLQWFSDAYTLVLAAVMLPAGMLGDRLGRKKVLLVSLALFGVSSAACAYATSSGELIAFRALLGFGAAAITPMSLSILPVLFRPEERAKAIAVMMGATFIAFPLGPLLGGWLLDKFWWGSVFLINVPVVVFALVAVAFLMPESRSERRRRMDPAGIVLSSLGLVALTYGFIEAGEKGWGDATALATMVAGVVVLVGFVAWQRHLSASTGGRDPLVDLALFRSAGFTWGTILATMVTFVLFGVLFTMPQYFQFVQGLDALGSGVRLLPLVGGMVVGMLAGARLQSRRRGDAAGGQLASPKALVTMGFAVMAVGLVFGTGTATTSGSGFVAIWFALAGIGVGLAMPTATNAALGTLTSERSGAGSAVISALRQVGATIGVAVLGTVLTSGYRSHLMPTGLSATAARTARSGVTAGVAVAQTAHSPALLADVQSAFVHGLGALLWICAGIALASAVFGLLFLPRRGATSAPEPVRAAAIGQLEVGQLELEVELEGAD